MKRAFYVLGLSLWATAATAVAGELVQYVDKPDDSYRWRVYRVVEPVPGVPVAELRLVSQTWKGVAWKHQLFVAYPRSAGRAIQGVLVVMGGSWKESYDEAAQEGEELPGEVDLLAQVAPVVGLPVALLNQVPFQPMFDGLTEDDLIAYTFDRHLVTGEEEWPLLLPMVKSAVRGMDAMTEYARQEWELDLVDFMVTGASKRGWTTWLTGAVDRRVNAIAPMVIDMLNMPEQMEHQLRTWGDYSHEISSYTELDLNARMATPDGRRLTSIVDPYTYRDRLTMPKMILLGTNDAYWPLEALNVYYDDLVGEKHILYAPNVGHGIDADRIRLINNVAVMAQKAAGYLAFPHHSWEMKEDAEGLELSVEAGGNPARAAVWVATSQTRDFRQAEWSSQRMEQTGEAGRNRAHTYVYHLARPEAGFAALYGEVQHRIRGRTLFLSTQVHVIEGAPPVTTRR